MNITLLWLIETEQLTVLMEFTTLLKSITSRVIFTQKGLLPQWNSPHYFTLAQVQELIALIELTSLFQISTSHNKVMFSVVRGARLVPQGTETRTRHIEMGEMQPLWWDAHFVRLMRFLDLLVVETQIY